jgi:B-cell receptor-associated protein 31
VCESTLTSDIYSGVAGSERMEVQARKFYSQRNMYLCGFTLFLSLILNRTYVMILDVLRLEQEVKTLKGEKPKSDKSASKLGEAGELGEIGRLKKQLEEKDRDIETLKKQSQGLSNEYNRLGDQMTQQDGSTKKER